jgi:hypothetical protein
MIYKKQIGAKGENRQNEKNKKKSLTTFKVPPILRTILHQFGANNYEKIANESLTTE